MNANPPAPDVSVLVTNWNGCNVLRNALRSIYGKTMGITFEVIVVDDASTDRSAEMVRKEFPGVRLIVNEQNVGFSRANNIGVPQARGRYVLLLNSDTVLVNNAIMILVRFMDEHTDIGVCGGLLLNNDMTAQISYGVPPSLSQAVIDAFFLNDAFPLSELPKRGAAPRLPVHKPKDVEYVTGADMMIRKSLIDRLGLFDEHFREYCEEVDFCYRVRRETEMRIVFVPEAQIIHLGGKAYSMFDDKHIRRLYLSYAKFLAKYHGRIYSLCTRFLYAWHYTVKMLVRWLRYVVASGSAKKEKRKLMLNAWYAIRYSLAPWK